MPGIGDFAVTAFGLDFARETQAERDALARGVDAEERAPITTDASLWAENPGRLDFPGIDTPTENPDVLPKDQMHPAETELTARARGESRRGDVPSTERNTTAPVTETAELGAADVSLAPEEAFEDVATGSQQRTVGITPGAFAGDEEADAAFVSAEEDRRSAPPMADERAAEGQLTDFGMETDATQHRDSRQAVEQASTFGVDDRQETGRGGGGEPDSGEQQGFEVFGGGVRENETLF